MKKLITAFAVIAVAVVAFTVSSCNQSDVIVIQNMDEINQCLSYSSFEGTTVYVFSLSKSDVQAAFQAAGVSFDLEKVKNAKVSQIKAEVTTTAATFNDISGFEVYVRKPGASMSEAIQVAYVGNIANNATEVTLNINGTDLKALLSENVLEIVLRVTNKNGSGAPICMKLKEGKLEYTVKAK
ncbi:MAG: hypothetical protein KIS94_08805 [Chitinophagales bacterium]|nr:hypothetical protein [Chitinophagales bacterium]